MFRFKLIPSKQKILILKHYVSFQVNSFETKNIDFETLQYVSFQTNCFEKKQKISFQVQKKFLKRKKLFL